MTDFDMRPARARDATVDVEPVTTLEQLADELVPVDLGETDLLVDNRPGWSVLYSLNLDGHQLSAWRRAARDDIADQVDDHLFNRSILAGQCRHICKDGKKLVDEAGQPVTFHSASLWRLLGVPAGAPSGATEAVKKFYGSDFAVVSTASAVLADAGFGKQARKAPDPTVRSSSA